jgi:hypothetical protein
MKLLEEMQTRTDDEIQMRSSGWKSCARPRKKK